MPHNPITLLSRDDLDRWHMRQDLERARSAYQANPTPANKARYLRAYRAALAWVMAEEGMQKSEGMIDAAVAALDADLNSKN
jgi:hypothetical protein